MSNRVDTKRAARDAARKSGRKNRNTRAVRDPSQDRMGLDYWNAADLSIAKLELKTIDTAAAKKAAKKAKNSTRTSKGKARKPTTGNAASAKARRKAQRSEGRKAQPPAPYKDSMRLNLSGSALEPSVELTIDGASTLTIPIQDPLRYIEASGILDRDVNGELDALDIKLDVFEFRLVKANRAGDVLTLTFEDKDVALLRNHSRPVSASRADQTRAQFIQRLVREVRAKRIIFYCPELYDLQPIAKPRDSEGKLIKSGTTTKITESEKTSSSAKNRKANSDLVLKGKEGNLSPGQIANARKVLARCKRRKAGPKATLAAVLACLVEGPDFSNPSHGDGTSVGAYQATADHGSVAHRRDIEAMTDVFLLQGFTGAGGAIKNAKEMPNASAGTIAQLNQGSAYPERYDQVSAQGKRIVEVLGDGGSDVGGEPDREVTTTKRKAYRFSRGSDGTVEDSWTAIQRLAGEVRWHAFCRGGALWYVSENWLLQQEPMAVISSNTRWVDKIDYDVDKGKEVQEVTVTARAARWAVLPGSTIAIDDDGPLLGRWIVAKVSRKLQDRSVTITLKNATLKKKELAPETSSKSRTDKADGSSSTSDNDIVSKTYKAAVEISQKTPGYLYGGGHGPLVKDLKPTHRLDCSSSSCLALYMGGAYPGSRPAIVSGDFSSWGKPGKGKEMTVWYNGGHVWIDFHGVGRFVRFDTGGPGGGNGPKVHTGPQRPTAGFQPRHYPGT